MLTYHLDHRSKTPLYEQLYRAVRADIMSGVLQAGDRLPSKRQFAQHLRVSQLTVETAYGQLLAEGYLESAPRRGYYVQKLTAPVRKPAPKSAAAPPEAAPADNCAFDFRTNIVDTGCFPFSTWARLSRAVLSGYSDRLLRAAAPGGAPELREQIARYLHDFRGLDVSPDRILVGAGSEYLIHLVIELLGRDRAYALENPGYRKLYQIFEVGGVPVRPLPLDGGGLRIDALEASDASAVYLTPSHHFPLGLVMPAGRRTELLAWANAAPGRYIIEDDYDSEFRYSSRPIPALGELDHTGRVIYVNTFAKSLAPSLRIGYLVLPAHLMARYREKCSLYSSTVPSFEQYTLADFMRTGGFERHISRSRKVYQSRRDALLGALKTMPIPHVVSGAEAGLHILLQVRNGMNEQTLIARAREKGVRVYGLSGYYMPPVRPPRATLVLGYAGLTEPAIREAVSLLCQAWQP
ncbi:MocR-like pyridoxine biosynthesis transcription factor PdxR [Agathobaculum sp.]|uniref:MocR-like pyridoxine biosynthesis transcription factor PdxR n=1 Tax=Agathobaculum sp. TaxID=2048138 RepID=UPI002A8362DF|nr:PLP-dependent aminotransferase family protein [Agathobaculum sp.]MDY3619153.1 PLP-dependent aminotransferase family protein [Agathobaculum sp.]